MKARLDLKVTDLGATQLKNIAEPVRVYSLEIGAPEKPTAQAAPAILEQSSRLALPDKPSIAVLPFDNLSGDPEQEYFSDGMAEDIITQLSHSNALFVIARNSSFTYKGRAVNVKQVGRELGVRYVLEGSVRRGGERVRITGQLIEAETGVASLGRHVRRRPGRCFRFAGSRSRSSVVGAIEPSLRQAEIERARTQAARRTSMPTT